MLYIDNQTFDNRNMKKGHKPYTKKEVSQAAVVLGTSSWEALTERLTPEQLRERLSRAGKLGGAPRKNRP